MRCTKCHYLSFEPEPRCRNCGHDLSLEEGAGFSMSEASLEGLGDSRQTATAVMAPPRAAPALAAARSASFTPTGELPLFVRAMSDGSARSGLLIDDPDELEPLVKVPARPRMPIAVRRTTPDAARLRAKYGMSPDPEPDLFSNLSSDPIDQVDLRDQDSVFQDLPLVTSPTMAWPIEPTPQRLPAAWQQPVGAGTRLVAAAIDVTLLGAITAVVIYLTLRITGLSIAQATLLPVLPLATLFLLFAGGYLLMFTVASGQTVGKMAMNIRVVGTSAEAVINDRVTISQAVVRSLAALPSVLALGAGFAPALVGAGLAVHDRIAHTRVVHL